MSKNGDNDLSFQLKKFDYWIVGIGVALIFVIVLGFTVLHLSKALRDRAYDSIVVPAMEGTVSPAPEPTN